MGTYVPRYLHREVDIARPVPHIAISPIRAKPWAAAPGLAEAINLGQGRLTATFLSGRPTRNLVETTFTSSYSNDHALPLAAFSGRGLHPGRQNISSN